MHAWNPLAAYAWDPLTAHAWTLLTAYAWTNGIGVAANAHLNAGFADAPWLEFPLDQPEWSLERRDFMLTQPFAAGPDGWITLSDAPGLGLELDEVRLGATRVG